MRNIRRLAVLATVFIFLAPVFANAQQQTQPAAATPKNVIIMIPDGCGPAAITLARLLAPKQTLAMDPYLVSGSISHSENYLVTDSAASATAIASGVRTLNEVVGMDPKGKPVAGVLEAAKTQKHLSIGLVVTSRVTHATPAAFSAHVLDRDDELVIAAQQQALGLDVLMGGGRSAFLPKGAGGVRTDGRNLIDEAGRNGVTVILTSKELMGQLKTPVLGLFADSHMDYAIARDDAKQQPTLVEMTTRAIELLSGKTDGFVLMVEGSRIDHAAHINDAATMVREILEFDQAFAAAVEFARRDGHTLVVSLADHETGGLAITGGQWSVKRPGPLRLSLVKTSLEKMANMILKGGQTPTAVLLEQAGVFNLDREETAIFEAQKSLAVDFVKSLSGTLTPEQAKLLSAQVEKSLVADYVQALAIIINRRLGLHWASYSHSAVDVHLYAFGPGSDRFRGALPHARVARNIADLLGLDLPQATSQMKGKFPASMPTSVPSFDSDD